MKTAKPGNSVLHKSAAGTKRPAGGVAGKAPRISGPWLRWFTWYARGYLRRHFHTLRVSLAGLPPDTQGIPLVVYSNHASWWDPLTCLLLKDEFFPSRRAFAPMDAAMLERYRFFGRLGFFGVEQQRARGAAQFLRTARAVLQFPQNLLAITPQSRFVDARERPIRFQAGLGHLATQVQYAVFVPLALEYVFWEERLPEILARFGEPVKIQSRDNFGGDAKYWTTVFEEKLAAAQNDLAGEALARNPAAFKIILQGGAGQGGVYDWWRALEARVRGETFRKEHGDK